MKDAIEPLRPLTALQLQTAVQSDLPTRQRSADDCPSNYIDIRRNPWRLVAAWGFIFLAINVVIGAALVFVNANLISGQRDGGPAKVNCDLTQACQAYFIKNQEWPADLRVLIHKDSHGAVYLDNPNAILDPWGKPFQYDANGPRNQGLKPDIWTVTPDGVIVGNWSPKEFRELKR